MEEELIKKLELYVKNYDMNDENIKLKFFHSIRVMEFAKEIAQSLALNKNDTGLAIIAGILHDYGRFEQWKMYHTYSDVDSIDHGDLAVELLFNQNEITKFYNNTAMYKKIYYAIKFHNKLKIPSNLDNEYVLLCNIVRDADKLDIFNLLIENKSLFAEDSCEITDKVKQNFFEEKCIDYKDIKNKSDKIVLILATLYDLKFKYSLEYIKENHIIDKLYDNIENKNKYKIFFEKLYDYFEKQTKNFKDSRKIM